jgi:hypothetical protein
MQKQGWIAKKRNYQKTLTSWLEIKIMKNKGDKLKKYPNQRIK